MPAPRRLAVEALEDRLAPAVTAPAPVGGVLTISFNAANDTAQVGSAAGGQVRVSGTGLNPVFYPAANVTSIVVTDTTGAGTTPNGQSLLVADDANGGQLTLTGPFTVTQIDEVDFGNPNNPTIVNGGLTIQGGQHITQSNTKVQIRTTNNSNVRLAARATGDAIGTAASPIKLTNSIGGGLSTVTTAGNGNQYLSFNVSGQVWSANSAGVGSINAGTGTVTLVTGYLDGLTGNDFADTTSFALGAGGTLGVTGAEAIDGLSGTGNVQADGGPGTIVVGGNGATSTFAGTFTDATFFGPGALSVTKAGSGTLTLTGASTYTGTTTVTGTGTLLVDGSLPAASAVTATGTDPANSLFLGGSGAANGPVVVGANAVIGPGSPAATGTLATGNLSFQAGGRFGVKVAGAAAGQFDALAVTGTVNLTNAGVFVFPLGPTPAVGSVLTVIANDGADPVVGTFTGLPEGGRFKDLAGSTYRVSYVGGDGNDVTLTAVGGAALVGPLLVTGPTTGTGTLYNPAGGQYQGGTQVALVPGFNGETHVALGDVNGDRVPDVVVGTGPGGSRVRVLDGASGYATVLADFIAFPGYAGGVFVAVGDLNGDGSADVAVTGDAVDAFSGPQSNTLQVRVFSGISMVGGTGSPAVLADFDGLASLNGASGQGNTAVRLGGRPAIADLNGDGNPDLLIAAGSGGGPRVTVWNGTGFAGANGGKPTTNPIANLFVFESTQRGGAFVTAGDITGDGLAEIVVGGGPGGGPRVRIVNAATLLGLANLESVNLDDPTNLANGLVLNNFFAGSGDSRGGIRVTVRDVDGDGLADVVVGTGTNERSGVRVYTAPSLAAVAKTSTEPAGPQTIDPFNGIIAGGVWVG